CATHGASAPRPHPSRLASLAPQRLCSLSSGLPLFLVSEHSVEDGEDFAGNGDEGDHFWLTAGEQTLVKAFQDWIATDGRQCGHVEGCSQRRPATTDHASADPTTGPTG